MTMMDIELNGTPHPVTENQNVHDLITALALSNQALAVAVNCEVVPRHLWAQHFLHANDRVDIVRAIGGG